VYTVEVRTAGGMWQAIAVVGRPERFLARVRGRYWRARPLPAPAAPPCDAAGGPTDAYFRWQFSTAYPTKPAATPTTARGEEVEHHHPGERLL
jgi:hypothetical protein